MLRKSVLFLVWLFPAVAFSQSADIELAREELPEHELVRCGKHKLMCFEFEPYKDLLELSYDRRILVDENTLLSDQILALRATTRELDKKAKLQDTRLGQWRDENDRLLRAWKKENELRHAAEMRANSPWPIVTIITGGLVGITGALWAIFDSKSAEPFVLAGAGAIVTGVGIIDFVF